MNIYSRLLGLLNRVFNKDPGSLPAIQLAYDGALTWQVGQQTLTLTATGGSGVSLSFDLTQYTVASLADAIGAQTGYSILYVDSDTIADLSALILIDGTGDLSVTGGSILYGYTSLLWSYMDAGRAELALARAQAENLPAEMSLNSADTIWLDFIGEVYGIPRNRYLIGGITQIETDSQYAPRVASEALQPRCNNIAMSEAIRAATGQQATVIDTPNYSNIAPLYNSAYTYDSAITHDGGPRAEYNLFSVTAGYDLEGGFDLAGFQALVLTVVNKFRAAGNYLASYALAGSTFLDTGTAPRDRALKTGTGLSLADTWAGVGSEAMSVAPVRMRAFLDPATAPSDGPITLMITSDQYYDGLRRYDGLREHLGGGSPVTETD